MPALTLADLSTHFAENGLANQVHGDATVVVTGCNTLEGARSGEITFLANPKYRDRVSQSQASAIIMQEDRALPVRIPRIICDDPYRGLTMAVIQLHGFRQHPRWSGSAGAQIHPSARIGEDANVAPGAMVSADVTIGRNANIYPGVFIGPGCRLGDDVLLYPNVVVYDGCRIGNRVTIHSGTVIGEDGLGYAPSGGKWIKIPQAGIVEIEDDVEIGANCAIDRATLGVTRIGKGTKFSNAVAIGHGCQIGDDCLFVAQVGLAGSVTVGRRVKIAGQAGLVGHLQIGDEATICAQAGVTASVDAGETVLGSPAVPSAEARRQLIAAQRLPELIKSVRLMNRELARLRKLVEPSPSESGRA